MKELFSKPWVLTVLGFILVAALVFAYTTCTGPGGSLTRKQERTTTSEIKDNRAKAAADTQAAARAAAAAAPAYDAGTAYANVAQVLHKQSKPHAKPTPVSDSAAVRLQRQLSAY